MTDTESSRSETGGSEIPPVSGELPRQPDACCKVRKVALAYQLVALDEELRRRYVDGNATLHELADYINDRITAVTLNQISNHPAVEPATVRAALDGEESLSPTKRDDIRAALAGQLHLDVLISSYVSHETVRRHLNEHLGVSTSRGGFETRDELRDVLQNYQTQYEDGVRGALERAGQDGLISGEDYHVFSTRIECQSCSETYRLDELFEAGGCDCSRNRS